uniref:CBM21 domain-containing protein n=1 Tax=Canis lupus familiaris TaxID=9615 RepID=A0A8C0NL70_CANLF
MSRERPPRTDIPRNLSFIAALTERAYYRSQRPSLEEEPEVEPGEGGTRLGARSRAHAPSRGRRALSAPAGGGGVRAPRSRSPDTRKRVRFADALGLELAAVRRFRPGELPRVPRHVQAQLQRDALRHFAPCRPRARGLQVGGRRRHAPFPGPPRPGRRGRVGEDLWRDTLVHSQPEACGSFLLGPRSPRGSTPDPDWAGASPDPAPVSPSSPLPQEARAALEPASEPGFAARLQAQRICLERAEAGPLGVAGSARVLDLAYEKRVSVRWSADGWRSQREAPAAYAGPAPPPPRADRFAFRLPAPPIGGALLFALRYRVTGHEFWDNNGGRDYALRGPEHPGSGGAPEPQGWIHFI